MTATQRSRARLTDGRGAAGVGPLSAETVFAADGSLPATNKCVRLGSLRFFCNVINKWSGDDTVFGGDADEKEFLQFMYT